MIQHTHITSCVIYNSSILLLSGLKTKQPFEAFGKVQKISTSVHSQNDHKGEGYVDLLMLFSTSLRLVEVIDDLNNHKQAMVVRAAYKMKDKARACVAVGG